MAEARGRGVPSVAVRQLVAQVTDEGRTALRAVEAWAADTRRARELLDAEVGSLELPDRRYAAVMRLSGMTALSDVADAIAHAATSGVYDR
jgi:hypothetical protein